MNTTIEWLKAAGVRAVKTMAQTAAAMITAGAMIQQVDWAAVAGTAALAGAYSVLTSIAGLPEVNPAKELPDETNGGNHD